MSDKRVDLAAAEYECRTVQGAGPESVEPLVRAARAMRAHWRSPTMETLREVEAAFAAIADSAEGAK